MKISKGVGISSQIDLILNEIEELKAIFVLSRRLMPFLEELFNFVREVAPMLDEINKSLEESSRKIPRASNQLDKVTRTTEMATTEILDALDEMSLKFGEVKGFINSIKLCHERQKKFLKRMERLIKKGEFEKVRNLWDRFSEVMKNCGEFDEVLEKLSDVKQNADDIMMALQFQDITAQQISAINHLISSVQEKLTLLLEKLGSLEVRRLELKSSDDVHASFNPSAEYDKSDSKQKIVDKIVKEFVDFANDGSTNSASQEEIDKLFNKDEKQIGT